MITIKTGQQLNKPVSLRLYTTTVLSKTSLGTVHFSGTGVPQDHNFSPHYIVPPASRVPGGVQGLGGRGALDVLFHTHYFFFLR